MVIHEEESLYCERGETLAQAAQKAEDAPTLAVLSQAGEILEHPALVGLSLETAVGTADYIISAFQPLSTLRFRYFQLPNTEQKRNKVI